jgi:hypothetical protein
MCKLLSISVSIIIMIMIIMIIIIIIIIISYYCCSYCQSWCIACIYRSQGISRNLYKSSWSYLLSCVKYNPAVGLEMN